MKLSEAIRLGSMIRPQAFGAYHNAIGSCAIGAAFDACGYEDDAREATIWPIIRIINNLRCPICPEYGGGLPHLNDDHRWTRERIADWVEQIENQASETSAEREEAELKR